MGFDPIDITQGANKALAILRGSGAVGYAEPGKFLYEADLISGGFPNVTMFIQGGYLIGLEVGKRYTVKNDSGTYNGVCAEVGGITYVGNLSLLDSSDGAYDTGELYVVVEAILEGTPVTMVADANHGTHITVSTAETIHTIDPKYLPDMGGGLPAVEITTEPTEEGAVLSEAESAELEAALNSANIIANLWLASINLIGPALLMRMEVGDQVGFAGAYAAKALQIVKTDGVWRFAAFGG